MLFALSASVWAQPGLVWSFGCVTDSDGRNVLEPFLRKLAAGRQVADVFGDGKRVTKRICRTDAGNEGGVRASL